MTSEIKAILSWLSAHLSDVTQTFVTATDISVASTGTREELSAWFSDPERKQWFITLYLQRQEPPRKIHHGKVKYEGVYMLGIYIMKGESEIATLVQARQDFCDWLVAYIKANETLATTGCDVIMPNKPMMYDLPDTFLRADIPLHVEIIS